MEGPVELGETGALEGYGTVRLLSGDSAYLDQSRSVVAQGSFLLDCTGEQMKIMEQMQKGGVTDGNT